MTQLSENFDSEELDCKCCGLNLTKPALVLILQAIRDHFDAPVRVVSGTRCAKHNRKVGGAKNSQHLLGTAADIQIDGVNPGEVARFAKSLMKGYGGIKASVQRQSAILGAFALLGLSVSGAISWFALGRLTALLDAMENGMRTLSCQASAEPLPVPPGQELGRLVQAYNHLIERLYPS